MLLLFFIYFSVLAFFVGSFYRAYRFARMPLHVRWELYPVPKEPAGRARYGGSYYEDAEWWRKPRNISRSCMIKEVLKEMIFMRKLFINQRRHWWLSYSMHLGIYMLVLWAVLSLAGAVAELCGLPLTAGEGVNGNLWSRLVRFSTFLSGAAGLLLLAAGSAGLFLRRIFNTTLSRYTTPQDYLNLLLIFAAAVTGLAAWSGNPGFNYGREIIKAMFTFSPVGAGNALAVHVLLLGFLMIYIPWNKMSHYICKFFAFHKVLWDNEPNIKNSRMEQKVKEALDNRPRASWSAPHANSPE